MIMPTGVSPWTVMRVIDEKIGSCSGPWAKPVRPFGYILCSLRALFVVPLWGWWSLYWLGIHSPRSLGPAWRRACVRGRE